MAQLMEFDETDGVWVWRLGFIARSAGVTQLSGFIYAEALEASRRILVAAQFWPGGIGFALPIELLAGVLGVQPMVLRTAMDLAVEKEGSQLDYADTARGSIGGVCLKGAF